MPSQNYVLFDGEERISLLPFTYTRSIADIRIGILPIREKWALALPSTPEIRAHAHLESKYPFSPKGNAVYISASLLPDSAVAAAVMGLPAGSVLISKEGRVLALHPQQPVTTLNHLYMLSKTLPKQVFEAPVQQLQYPWDIFRYNGDQIRSDIALMNLQANGHLLEGDNKVLHPERIFVAPGAKVTWSMLNASDGPIYLGPDSEVMEGCIIKGPFALGEHAQLKMGAKIYGDTSIGPYCKAGGEIGNSVLMGYSNKGHDGYLGNSVLGEWCNLGADTNNSNLKNNYSTVKAWSYAAGKEISTGLQFCGLIMGDHSKCGINTMFNTGTVVGVSANIYGGGFPPKFIPSFAWGGAEGFQVYEFDKAIETAERVMARRKIELTDIDKQILWQVYEDSNSLRKERVKK
jgi:UDP-N-acetylglucosamine diphosphorylase/glucosamine-1-phosphate N-acetyltransferase